jgi:uncharacterized membrane protein
LLIYSGGSKSAPLSLLSGLSVISPLPALQVIFLLSAKRPALTENIISVIETMALPAMSAGLITGMGYLAFAMLFTVIMCAVIIVYNHMDFA